MHAQQQTRANTHRSVQGGRERHAAVVDDLSQDVTGSVTGNVTSNVTSGVASNVIVVS